MFSFVQITHAASVVSSTAGTVADSSSSAATGFVGFIIDKIDNWIAAIVIVFLSFVLAKVAKTMVLAKISSHFEDEHQDVLILVGRTTFATILLIGITAALKVAGIDLTALLAALGFGVGFAMQDLIMNFFAGIMILATRQFTIGDIIKVGDTMGKVVEIQTRATILKAFDGTKVIVPNADLFTNQVTSFTANPLRRIAIDSVGITYDSDLKLAMKICLDILKKNKNIIQAPAPSVVVTDFGDSSIDLGIKFWVEARSNWIKVKAKVLEQIKTSFDKSNGAVDMPYPTQTLFFGNNPMKITDKAEVALSALSGEKDDDDEKIGDIDEELNHPATQPATDANVVSAVASAVSQSDPGSKTEYKPVEVGTTKLPSAESGAVLPKASRDTGAAFLATAVTQPMPAVVEPTASIITQEPPSPPVPVEPVVTPNQNIAVPAVQMPPVA